MKYAYDKGFRKTAINMPFSSLMCKLTHKPMEKMLDKVKIPKGVTVHDLWVKGYREEEIKVKEIIPENPADGAILVLHGGGFGYKTSPHQFLNACRYASELHCRAYLPDYHLLPDYPFPAAHKDVMSTYVYLIEHALELAIHSERIIVLGDSAGGTLAANLCNMVTERSLPMPLAQVLIYPATDNAMTTESMKRFSDTPLWNSKNNKKMWDMYLKNSSKEEISIAVPMKNLLPEILPPTYIETAEFDCLHDEGIAYAKHIQGVAKEIEVNETKGTVHGYDVLQKHHITQESLIKRIEFMKRCLMIRVN